MKKNLLLAIFTTFLLTFVSVAYAAFNSELTITGSGLVKKDTTAPTCGTWYLRDSNLTLQEAYNQNKFKNPADNTTWTNTNQKLFIECTDNMDGDYGCIDVTEITDSNNNKRYFKEVKEYTTSIKTDQNVVTVTLQDAYLNSTTCTLPVGGSNPYLDKQAPTVTITQSAANKFTYSATDDLGVTGYQVTTSSTEPTTWLTTPAEVTIDNTAAKTYYVWAKDGVNVSYQTINTYLLTRTQGTGTTLTLKYKNNSGATLASSGTQYVLNGTQVYSVATPNTGYNTVVLKKGTTTVATGSGTNSVNSTINVSAATTISSSATPDSYTATFYYNSDSTSGSMSIATATAECTISGSNTSCNATIPDEVKNSVGKYNSEFLGVSASLNNGTSAGTTTVSLNGNKNFYAFYSSPVTIYYPSATVDGTTGALSNTSVGHYDYYRNEFITNVTSGSEAMSAVLNSTQTATSNFTFTPSATGYALRGFATVANSTTRTYSSVAVAAASDSSEIYAFIRKGLKATVYYNAGSGDGTLTVATATTATAYRTMYCGTTTTIKMSNANFAIPDAVSTSVGQYGNKRLNLSQALNSMTGNRYTSASSNSTDADTKVLYAIYQSNDVEGTTTNVTNYYYNGTSYISRTLYRNSFFTSVTGSGAMTTVLSTSTTGKTNYSTAVGPGNSVWSGLSNAQDTTAEHASVAAAAISTDLNLYTVYTMNITYEKGSNVSTIGKNSDSCKLTTDSTSCDVTLPTITANTGYTSVGWSATNGDTTGVTGTYSNSSNTTKLYANATANAYTIAYAMNNGANPNPKPTSGTYGSNVSIGTTSMPTKTVTITGNANGTGAAVGSATVNTQTFGGWTSSSSAGLQGNAQSGSTTSNFAAWTGTATTNKYFKNLRNASGTVTLTATWSGTATLPTVTKTGYTCSWYDTNGTTGGNLIGNSGGSYTVPSNSGTALTIYARCTPNTYTVTANSNGGSIASTTGWTGTGNTSTKSVTYDAAYGTLPTVSRTGYTLAGWTGKNLVNIADQNISFTNNYYKGQGSNSNYILEPNTTYTLSFDYVVNSASQAIYASIGYGSTNFNMDLKQGSAYSGTGKMIVTFTTPETFATGTSYEPPYVWFRLVRMGTKGDANVDVSNIQFEKGSTATPYEPYYITPETIVTTDSNHDINAVWVDDTAPVVVTATASSTWDLENYVDFNATDAGSGIVGYNITTTTTAPTTWIPVVDAVETTTETKYELNSAWARVFHHNTHWGQVLYSAANSNAEIKSSNTVDKYSVLANMDNYKNSDTWEYLLQYPDVSLTAYNRWSQTSNPVTTNNSITGYNPISISWTGNGWGGIALGTGSAFIDGSPGNSNWWYAIGAKSAYQGGIPGPNSIIASTVNLWSRIDNLEKTTSSDLTRRIGDIKTNGTYYVWVKDSAGNTAYKAVTVSNVDTTAPATATITSTNNVATSQTATLTMGDTVGVTRYYWGTSNPASSNVSYTNITSATSTSITKTVSNPGTYYLGLQDAAGNRTVTNKAFYKTTLTPNKSSVSPASVVTMNGNSFVLPTPTALTGYTWGGWYTDEGLTTPVTLTSGAYKPTANTTLYGKWTANTYTIAYTMNNGSNPNPKPTSGTYDSDVVIGSTSMPTKTITITGNANNTGATVGSASINSMTFNGWTTSSSAGLGSGAKTGTAASPSTAWNGSATTNKYFKNLRDTSGTVTLTANWSTSVTLPTLTDPAGYTCKYYTDATAGTEMGSGGATYTVANNSPTSITAFVRCTAKPLVFDDQTVTKTFSTSSQSANVTPASNGTGSYTYSKVSGESDITVSAGGVITIPASKAANTTGYNVVIRATDSNSGATADATYTIKINQANCKLAVSNPANKTPDDTYDLSTLVTANAGTVTYALKTGGNNTTTASTISGSTLTIGAMSSSNDTDQTVDVQFTDPGSNDYEGCTIDKSVTVKKKTNTLAANNQTVYVSSTTALSSFIKNNNGGTVTYTKGTDNTSGSSINGSNFVAGTLAANDDANKTVAITATSARTTKVAQGTANITVTVQKYTRGLTLTINPVNVKYNKTASLSTSNTGSGGTPGTSVTYTSSNTSVFTVTGSTIKAIKSSGTSDITATRAGSTTVKAATATATATATQDDCQLTISNTSMTTGSNLDLTTVATNAVGEVTFAIKTNGTTTASTLSGSTLTAGAMSTANDNAQTVVVTATEAATANYNSCSKDISITVNKQTNTLAADNKTVYVSSTTALSNLTKNNNGGSLSASITTDNTAGSSISGTNFNAGVLGVLDDSNKTVVMTVTSARTTKVAQGTANITVTVQKYTRALTITTPTANQQVEYNKTITAASTNGGSGGTPGAVTYSSSNTSIFTVTGTTIKAIKSSGTATIGASRAGSTTVKAATATGVTISAKKATNPMTFTTPQSGSVTFSTSAQNKAFTAAASAQGTVTYSITSQSIQGGAGVTYFSIPTNTTASMSVAANTPVGTYTIVIKASAAGNTNYNVLELETTYTLTVGKKKATIALTDSSKALTYPTAGTNTYTYDGAATPTCSSSNTEYVTCSVDATNHKITVTPVKPTSSAVTITVSATEASGSNYSSPDNKTFTVTVAKGTLTATATALNGTYSGSAQYAKIKVTKSDWDGGTIVSGTTTSYGQSVTTSGVYNTNYNLKPGYTNVTSSTTIYYKITGGTYYNDLTGSTTAKINQKKATITLTDSNKALTYPTAGTNTYTYDGDGTVSCSSSDTTYVTCSVDATNHKITVTPVKPTSSAVTITVSAGNGTNYSAADNKTFTVTVAKGTLTATATALNGTYSGSAQYAKIKVTKSDWDGGTIVSGTTTSYGQSVTTSGVYNTNYNLKPGYTNVTSSTTIYYKITGGTYYNDLTGSTTAAIGQKKATITRTDATKALTYPTAGTNAYTYDGDGTLSCTSSDTAYVTCSVDTTNHVITVTPVKPTSTAVTITLSATAGTNYSAPDNKTFTVTVAKGTLTATATALNGTYSGSAQYAKIKVTKSDWDGGTIVSGTTTSYGQSVTTSGVYNTNYNLKPGYTNVTSSTTIYYKITGGTYYNDLTGSTTATIGKKKATITLTDSSKALTYPTSGSNTYTYDGTATPTCTSSSTTYVTCTVDATNHKITVTPVKPTTSAVTITVSATEASGSNYSSPDNKTFTVTVAKGTCPAPTNVAIASNKKVSWTNASGASSYEISMSASSGFTAHTNNTAYNSITDSTGSRTVYVRSVCNTNYYSSANSSNASATTTVYSVSLTKGTGISSVSGGGNYITGASASIDATVSSGYTWSNWTGTSIISNKSTSVTVDNNKSYTANATPNTYSISLDNQGATSAGTTIAYYQYKTKKVINGTTCYYYTDDTLTTCLASGYLITNPTKTGYTFGGYYTSTGGSGTNYINSSGSFVNNIYQKLPSEINSNYTDQITLYAKWTANTYTIAYSMNNGNNPNPKPTSGTYNSDVVIGSTTMPTKTVTFTGNANGTGASVGSAAVSTQTFTGWTSSTSAGLGSGAKTGTSASPSTAWTGAATTNKYFRNLRDTSGTVTLTATWSGTATLPTVTKEGYTCKWYDTSGNSGGNLIGNSGGSYTVPSASATAVTLYARCTINSYTLTINPNNGTFNGTTSNTTVTQNYGTTYNVANNPTRAGYIFAGWKLTSGDGNVTYFQDSEKLQQYLINSTSANKPGVYNNKGNGTVTHTLQADSTSSTGYSMKIVTNGEASPGAGGFVNSVSATAGAIYYHKIVAKVPTGYTINMASNTGGVGYGSYWLTSNAGTGDWATYIYIQYDGYNGPFSSFGHVYVSGSNNQSVTWYINESTIYRKGSTLADVQASNIVFGFKASNATLTAQWSESGATVTWDKQGGTFGNGTIGNKWTANSTAFRYLQDLSATKKAPYYISDSDFAIYKDGYVFDGFYTTANTGGTQIFDATGKVKASVSGYSDANRKWQKYDSNVTLYARWIPNVVTVNLKNGTAASTKGYSVSLSISDSSDSASYTATNSNGTVTFSGVPNGTYYVWSGKNSNALSTRLYTGQTVTVNNNSPSAVTVQYYTLTLSKGTGISAVSNAGTSTTNAVEHLYNSSNKQNIAIDATVSSGYTWSTWTASGTTPTTYTATTKNQNIKMGAGAATLTASATYTATPTITRSDYNTFTVSATAGSKYIISKTITSKPAADNSAWSTTTTKDVSTTAKETWYVWVMDANNNVSANSATITNYQVSLTANVGTSITAKADNSSSGANVTSGSYVLANTPVFPTGALANGYESLVVKKGSTTITNGSSQTITADTTFSSSATAATYTIGYTLNGGSVSPANPTSYTVESNAITLTNPTKTGYTFTGWTGSNGTTPQTSVTIAAGSTGNKTYTANYSINNPATPTISGNGGRVYNHAGRTLTCATTTTYASGTSIYYQFGYATSTSNWTSDSITWIGSASTTATYDVAKNEYIGTRYYGCRVYASDGTSTSGTIKSTSVAQSFVNSRLFFDVDTNGGTRSGSANLYVPYGLTNIYTGRTNQTSGTIPTATKTGYTFNGWYTASSGGSQVINASGVVQASVSGWTDGNKKWLRTSTTNNDTVNPLYAQFTANTYTIAYAMNYGGNPNPKPTTGTYDSDVVIGSTSMPTKSITVTGNANNTGATVGSATINSQTFTGWTSSISAGLGSGAKTGTSASPSTAWTGTATTNKYFRNLRDTSGTVTLTANWSGTATLPTLTKTNAVCKWYSNTSDTTPLGNPGESFVVASDSTTAITVYAKCEAAHYKIGSTYYVTLADALDAASSTGTTIYAVDSHTDTSTVSLSSSSITSVTLNTNGYTITRNGYPITVGPGVTLNITGSGTIAFTGADSGGRLTNNGTVTFANATISKVGERAVENNGTFTMNSGKIQIPNSYQAVYNGSTGTFNMNNGTLEINSNVFAYSQSIADNYGTFNLAGGSLNNIGTTGNGMRNFGTGVINMTGGTIQAKNSSLVGIANYSGTAITNISGGTINSEGIGLSNEEVNGTTTINLTGGTVIANLGIMHRGGTVIIGDLSETTVSTTVPSIQATTVGIHRWNGSSVVNFFNGEIISDTAEDAIIGDYITRTGYFIKNETYNTNKIRTYLIKGLTVTLDADGGSVSPSEVYTLTGRTYGELPTPTKTNKVFKGWKLLPSDYTPVKYIESTGTQWIDTGVTPNQDTKMQFNFRSIEITGDVILGYYTGSDTTDYRFFNANSNVYFDKIADRINTSNGTSCVAGTDYNFEIGNYYVKDLNTGTNIVSGTASGSFTGVSTIKLNNYNNTSFAKTRVYSLKIYDGSTLVRDFIPVIKESTGKAGLYDKVNGVFYGNSGTGNFIAGSTVSQEYVTSSTIVTKTTDHSLYADWVPAITVTFNADGGSVSPATKQVATGMAYGELPTPTKSGYVSNGWYIPYDGYTAIEYIETDGSSWINTGVAANTIYGLEFSYTPVANLSTDYKSYLSGTLDNFTLAKYVSDGTAYIRYRAAELTKTLPVSFDSINKLVINDGKVTHGSQVFEVDTTSPIATTNANLIIANNASFNRAAFLKIYGLTLYDSNGDIMKRFIPAIKNSTGEIGMYEVIGDRFYGNSGTGTLTAGNRKYVTASTICEETVDHELKADWAPAVTVTFDASGGSVSPSTKQVPIGGKYGDLPTPTGVSSIFTGWAMSPATDYIELEYIESTGIQYINTGINTSNTFGVYAKMMGIDISTESVYFGATGSSTSSNKLRVSSSKYYFDWRTKDTAGTSITNTGITEIEFNYYNSRTVKVDGTSVKSLGSGVGITSTPMFIFATNNRGTASSFSSMRLYELVMTNSTSTINRNFVPVKKISTGEVGLYDKKNNVFYGNQGTGEFIAGPIKYVTSNTNVELTTDHRLVAVWSDSIVFNYTGDVQTFTAPVAGTYLLEVCGAQGGTASNNIATREGGKGGCASGTVSLSAGQTLYVFVGGQGNMSTGGTSNAGGYNGGGDCTATSSGDRMVYGVYLTTNASGGGATHISKTNTSIANAGNNLLIVGGGGGGAHTYVSTPDSSSPLTLWFSGTGGNGGGSSGDNGTKDAYDGRNHGTIGYGGTQSAGGSTGGSLGQGGTGSGGGGGGYYGGGGSTNSAGGGGGSGYIGGVSSGTWTSTSCANYHNLRTGNGCAKITKQ